MTRERFRVFLASAACALLLLAATAGATHIERGIHFWPGETLITELSPSGDVDLFVFYGVEGAKFSYRLEPLDGGALPTIEFLDAAKIAINDGAYRKVKGTTLKMKNYPLDATGAYYLRVTRPGGGTVRYQLATKGKMDKVPPYAKATIGPGGQAFLFGAGIGIDAIIKLKAKGNKAFTVTSVFDPDGEEIPHGIGAFIKTVRDQRAMIEMRSNARSAWREGTDPRRLGVYGIRVTASEDTALKVKIKVKHRRGSGTRVIATEVPVVDTLDPGFGRSGTEVRIHGQNFLPGDIEVLFGDAYAKMVTYVSSTEIATFAPFGEGEVAVTVINPDGQEGVLEDAFIFIPLPPNIGLVTPVEGPSSGDTLVDVFGDGMTYVEKVRLGNTEMTGEVSVISDTNVQFTTDALPGGTYSVTVVDAFGQETTLPDAFTMIPPPALTSLSVSEISMNGGDVVDCVGDDFRPTQTVTLGGTPVATIYLGEQSLRFTAPAGSINDSLDVGVRDEWDRSSVISNGLTFRDGWFRDVTSSRMPANTSSQHVGGTTVALGDIDGDSDFDLVIGRKADSGTNQTILLKNDGSGGFMAGVLGNSPVPNDDWQANAVAMGDLDDDGDLDLVVTTDTEFTTSNSWWSYTYWSYKSYWYWWSYSYRGTNIPYPSTRVLKNDGKGAFSVVSTALPAPNSGKGKDTWAGSALALGDVDDDGDLDIILSHQEQATTTSYTERSNYWIWSYYSYYSYWGYVQRSWSQDPSDTKPATRVLLNNGSASFSDASTGSLPAVSGGDLFSASAVALVDVDGDDDLDLVLTGDHKDMRDSDEPEYLAGSKTRILLNNGSGVFTNATATLFPKTKTGDDWGGMAMALEDIDGDGDVDLVLSTTNDLVSGTTHLPSTRLFVNSASGFSEAAAKLPGVRSDGNGEMLKAVSVALINANSDAAPDIVLLEESVILEEDPGTGLFTRQVSSLRILRNDGTGSFSNDTEEALLALGSDKYLGSAVMLGDLDRDGDNDLIVTTDLANYSGVGVRPTRQLEFK